MRGEVLYGEAILPPRQPRCSTCNRPTAKKKPSCTHSGQASASPARAPEDPGDCARQARAGEHHTLPSRARARPRARGRKEEAVIVYHRTRDRMPTHDLMMKWLSTVKNVETGSITLEKMKLDEKGFPQPTGEFESLDFRSARAWPGCGSVAPERRGWPGDEGPRRAGRAEHDNGRALFTAYRGC